jgi:ketosteroid isomerase-like protein
MSGENVEAVKRAFDAFNRGDLDAMLKDLDPEVEWHPMFQMLLGGEGTVYRGHEGVREMLQDTREAFTELQAEPSEVRDFGERVLAIGRFRARGRESGAKTETANAWLVEFKNGKGVRIREYLDPDEALEAAGL